MWKTACKKYEKAVDEFHARNEAKIVENGNIRSFFNYANSRLKGRAENDIAPLKRADGSVTLDKAEKCIILNSYFATVFTVDNGVLPVLDT